MTARTRTMVLVLAVALLGFLSGARAVVGAPGEPVSLAASGSGSVEADALRGAFWRPAGSDAERPVVRLEPVAWSPSESKPRLQQPDALASMQAVVRLASID